MLPPSFTTISDTSCSIPLSSAGSTAPQAINGQQWPSSHTRSGITWTGTRSKETAVIPKRNYRQMSSAVLYCVRWALPKSRLNLLSGYCQTAAAQLLIPQKTAG
eukprot:Mycagemm_TRINITY_DN9965_c0_g1::TRINITY_DN9965_c0_g1_i1::g.3504::m.3504 type:complete len:104 gc:universal TRINITY_DN9965_c0_g1_i1:279-590(+)